MCDHPRRREKKVRQPVGHEGREKLSTGHTIANWFLYTVEHIVKTETVGLDLHKQKMNMLVLDPLRRALAAERSAINQVMK
jgi:hypothetical protein